MLKAVTGDDLSTWQTLQLPNQLRPIQWAYTNPSRGFLYQDILTGVLDKRVLPGFAETYAEHAKTLKKMARKSKKFGYIYRNMYALCDLLSLKANIGNRLRSAYSAKNNDELHQILVDLKTIEKKLDAFTKTEREQWYIENKPFGFDITDGRLGFLKNRIITAEITLKNYLDGKTQSIPELEEEVLLWNDFDPNLDRNIGSWQEMASVNTY